jgi:hypothetical protein
MKASMTKASMNASINKNSKTSRALLSIPGAILSPNAGGKCYDDVIAKGSVKSKLSGIISKK